MARELVAERTTLNAAGDGSVVLGPPGPWESWTMARLTVRVDPTGTPIPEVVVYQGTPEGGRILSATKAGDSNTDDFASPVDLPPGVYITVRWTGGPPGGRAAARLYGTSRRIAGRGV